MCCGNNQSTRTGGVVLNRVEHDTQDAPRGARGHWDALVRGLLTGGLKRRSGTSVRHMRQSGSGQPETGHNQPRIEGRCRRGDSNPHEFPRRILSALRMPFRHSGGVPRQVYRTCQPIARSPSWPMGYFA